MRDVLSLLNGLFSLYFSFLLYTPPPPAQIGLNHFLLKYQKMILVSLEQTWINQGCNNRFSCTSPLTVIHSLLQDVIDCLPSEYTGEPLDHS